MLLAELEIEDMPVDKVPREFVVAPRLVILEDLRSISIHCRHLFVEALRARPLRHDHALVVVREISRSLQHVAAAFETDKKTGFSGGTIFTARVFPREHFFTAPHGTFFTAHFCRVFPERTIFYYMEKRTK
jgi:hypothetical protein